MPTVLPLRADEIVRRLRARDETGLTAVFEQYGPALNGVITRIVRDRRIAEEVLQDTLLRIWTKIDLYDPTHGRLFTWAMGIARNAAIDHTRLRGFREMRKSEDLDAHVERGEPADAPGAAVDVAALTGDLDPKYVDVLRKMYLEGYSATAVAEELDLPLGTVKTRLRTALILLRGKIKNERDLFFAASLLALLAFLWLLR